MEENNKENKMGDMPMLPLILGMSVPMMLSMLVQALYNIVDSIFVAQLGEDALAAVSIAFPVQTFMLAFAVGTATGVNALLSMRLGQGNTKAVGKVAMNGFLLAIVMTVIFIILRVLFLEKYFETQTANANIISYGIAYLNVILLGGFGIFGVVMSERLLQSTGKTVYSMISQMAGAITNIILDPLMIFGIGIFPKWGMAGAAIATIIGQVVGFCVSLYFNLFRNKEIPFKIQAILPDFAIIKQVYAIGIPTILNNSLMSVTTYLMNRILGTFNSTAIAVYGAYFKLNSFIIMPIFGLNNALIPVVAYNYGALKKERVIHAIKLGVKISIVIMSIGTLIFEIFPKNLLFIFNASNAMLDIGIIAIRLLATTFLLAAVGITFDAAFQALNAATYAAWHTMLRQIIVLLPSAYLLSRLGNINLVWLAFPIAESVSVVVAIIFMARVNRRRIQCMSNK